MKKSVIRVALISIVSVACLAWSFFVVSCADEFFNGKRYVNEELVVNSGIDGVDYDYRNGLVIVSYSTQYGDCVTLEQSNKGYKSVFKGSFVRHGWKDGVLAVETEHKYYVLNVNEYKKFTDYYDQDVGVEKLTESEFEKAYPYYDTFYWHDCPIVRDEYFTFRNIYN